MFFMKKEKYVFDVTLLGAAHKWCQKATRNALMDGKSVVVANTFTTAKEIKDYREIAEEFGILLKIVNVNGNFKSIHNVPEEAMQRMRARWQDITK